MTTKQKMSRQKYYSALTDLNNRAKRLIVPDDVLREEMPSLDGMKVVQIQLGKSSYQTNVVGLKTTYVDENIIPRAEIVGALTTKVQLAEELNTVMLKAEIRPYLSELVIGRLTEGDEWEDDKIIEQLYNKKVVDIIAKLEKLQGPEKMELSVTLATEDQEEYPFMIHYRNGQFDDLSYGENNMRDKLHFLKNLDENQKLVDGFVKRAKPLFDLRKER